MVRIPPRLRRRRQSDRFWRDTGLARAIADAQIDLVFQPQVDPDSGEVRGVEALARWSGAADADMLFERARRAGLEARLNRHVQMRAIAAAARWAGAAAHLRLSLNLLAEELAAPAYGDWLLRQLATHGLSPARISLELVERGTLSIDAAVDANLSVLRMAGVRILLDDFGVGENGLSRLATLPVDGVKLDRSLIAGLPGSARHRTIVAATLDLARALDLTIVVEGVETVAQLDLLADWGCDLYQGFLDAGPLAETELLRFVAASQAASAAA